MGRVLSKDLAQKDIRVNTLAPSPAATDLFFHGKSDEMLKTIAGFSPFNRIGEPDDIASAMVFLCGKDSSWVSGQVVRVNGAMA